MFVNIKISEIIVDIDFESDIIPFNDETLHIYETVKTHNLHT